MGDYDASPYPYWITLRGMTERYGAGVPSGGEQVMQDFWEETSKNTGNNLTAMSPALHQGHHAGGRVPRLCSGREIQPRLRRWLCVAVLLRGGPQLRGPAGTDPRSSHDHDRRWEHQRQHRGQLRHQLGPAPRRRRRVRRDAAEHVTRRAAAGQRGLRHRLGAHDYAAAERRRRGGTTTLTNFDSSACTQAVAVITNQSQTAANPPSSTARTYQLSAGGTPPPPPPTITVSDAEVTEPNAGSTVPAVFNVSLSSAAAGPVTVNFATSSGKSGATAGTDYVTASGQVSFAPGETAKSIEVTVNGDTIVEPTEQFTLTLSNPVGATIVDGTGVGTVLDGGGGPPPTTVSVTDAAVTEGNAGSTVATFTVSLASVAAGTVTVNFATSSAKGGATAGSDYVAATGQVSFAPGETTKIVQVTVNGDTILEPSEQFTLTLSNAVGATIADGTGIGTILNDD